MHLKRYVWILIGLCSAVVGYIGIFVPGLPTTVFVIISVYSFSKSSEKLNKKLRSIPIFSSSIEHADRYLKYKVIPARIKLIAQLLAWTSTLIVFILFGISSVFIPVLIGAISCSLFMICSKTDTLEK